MQAVHAVHPDSIPNPESIVATHKPALKMIISRLVQRHPEVSEYFRRIRREKGGLLRGVVDIYSLTGCDHPACQTFYVISFKNWFAQAVCLKDILLANPNVEADFLQDKDSVSFIVEGTIGISTFHGELIPFLVSQFPKLRMPNGRGLDTEVLVNPALHARKTNYRAEI